MIEALAIEMPKEELASICQRFGVAELCVFGSVTRPDFGPDSDIDFLVTFKPNERVGLMTLARMMTALEDLFGRRIDLVPKDSIKPVIRDEVLASARVVYAA